MATMIIPSRAYGARAKRTATGPGFWTSLLEALKASRQREAEAIVARYAAGRWCDQVEREINDKLIRREQQRLF